MQASNKYIMIRKDAPVTAVTIVNLQARRQPSSSKWRSGFIRKDGLMKFFLRNQICFDGSGGTSKWSLRISEIIAIAAAPARKTHTNTVECSQRLHIFNHEYLVIASRLEFRVRGMPLSLVRRFFLPLHETGCPVNYPVPNKLFGRWMCGRGWCFR